MRPLVTVSALLLNLALPKAQNLYDSPCPDIFNYSVRDNVLQYGVIRLRCPETTDCTHVELQVELSIGNNVQGYNGDLVLHHTRMQTIEDIIGRKPITYKVLFPRWYNYPPKVTKITINGHLVCAGPPIDINLVRVLTTINLQHTLKLNVPNTVMFPSFNPSIEHSHKPSIDFNPQPFQHSTATSVPQQHSHNQFLPPSDNDNNDPFEEPTSNHFQFQIRTTTPPQPLLDLADIRSGNIMKPMINADECGISLNTNHLIANGRNVQKGQFPWLVAIFTIKSLGPEFLCGGSLISNRHVITAGHCLRTGNEALPRDKIFVRIGQHNIHQWTDPSSYSISVEKVLVHNDYKSMSADGDVALVNLVEPVVFNKFIKPICLWTEDLDLNRIVGQVGTVVGWGKDENNQLITPEPKQVKFPVVSQEDCLRSHFTFREITSKRTFCAGFRNGSGPCNGDSGGGFILERNNRWTLRGVVSMSIAKDRTCDFSQYFVFSDVSKFMTWILDNL